MIIKDKMRLSNSYPNCAEPIFSGCLKGVGVAAGRVNLEWLVIVENFAPVGDVEIQRVRQTSIFFSVKKTPNGKKN